MHCKILYWKDITWMTRFMKRTETVHGQFGTREVEVKRSIEELLPKKEQLETDFVQVAEFETKHTFPEAIYRQMNTNPHRHFNPEAYKQGVDHTSMSIGDIVILGEKRFLVLPNTGLKEF